MASYQSGQSERWRNLLVSHVHQILTYRSNAFFSTMGLSAISDFAGFNQIAASSNFALIYKYDVSTQSYDMHKPK